MKNSENTDTIEIAVEGEISLFTLQMVTEMCERADDVSKVEVLVESESGFDIEDTPEYFYNDTDTPEFSGIKFADGSRAEQLTGVFCSVETKWRDSGEIRRELVPETNIGEDDLSQVLWDLSERGILEKKPCESDGRMKEYRISELGRKSYEDFAED